MKFLIDENLPDCLKIWSSTDFHERILYRNPPPKVIPFKLGNTSTKYLEDFFALHWKDIEEQINSVKLLIVFRNKIEGLR